MNHNLITLKAEQYTELVKAFAARLAIEVENINFGVQIYGIGAGVTTRQGGKGFDPKRPNVDPVVVNFKRPTGTQQYREGAANALFVLYALLAHGVAPAKAPKKRLDKIRAAFRIACEKQEIALNGSRVAVNDDNAEMLDALSLAMIEAGIVRTRAPKKAKAAYDVDKAKDTVMRALRPKGDKSSDLIALQRLNAVYTAARKQLTADMSEADTNAVNDLTALFVKALN